MTLDGTPVTYVGARVYCPVCKSEGVIVQQGRRLPSFDIKGREAALNGDLCVCRCERHPQMLASHNRAYVELDEHSVANNVAGNAVEANEAKQVHSALDKIYSRRIYVWDSSTGEALKHQAFVADVGGGRQLGKTDNDGYATIETRDSQAFRIHILFSSPKRNLEHAQ